jgi:hypothetical protein
MQASEKVGAFDIRDARLMQTLEDEMTAMSWVVSVALVALVETGSVQSATGANADPTKAQITLLYDAFGQNSAMQKDWGMPLLSNTAASAFCSTPETTRTSSRRMRWQKEST